MSSPLSPKTVSSRAQACPGFEDRAAASHQGPRGAESAFSFRDLCFALA